MSKILVTGGAGYIGSHTVRELMDAGHDVVVYDSLEGGHKRAVGKAELVEADLAEVAQLKAALAGVDAVIHFAAYIRVDESVEEPAKYFRNNFTNTLVLLEAMRDKGVKELVFSSTAAVYGEPEELPVKEDSPAKPINPYGLSKLMAEQAIAWHCSAYGMRAVSLRYFNASGAHKSGELGDAHQEQTHLGTVCIKAALGEISEIKIFGTDWNTPDGTCLRDYIHVSDLARAHVLSLEKIDEGDAHRVYNLGTGNGVSVKQVIAATKKVSGVDFKVVETGRRAGDPEQLVAAVGKARDELGFTAGESGIENIVATAWKWHKSYPNGYD